MSAPVIGELTADGANIFLMGLGGPGENAHAADLATTLTPLVSPTDGGLLLPLSWPACVQLVNTYGAGWHAGPRLSEWIGGQIAARMGPTDQLSFATPAGLVPRDYQVEGSCMIANGEGALIFDDPGVGKTVTCLLGLRELQIRGADVLPILVVCPASVIPSWVRHVQDWVPDWSAVSWRGPRRRRHAGLHDVYVTSYETLRMDAPAPRGPKAPLMHLGLRSLVLDEVHRIKTSGAKQSVAARRVADKVANFVGMSGTPISHTPMDIWPTLRCLEPTAWTAQERFQNRYLLTAAGDYDTKILGFRPSSEPEFWQTLEGRHRRVAKADVLTQLPPKVYSVRTVELPDQWRKAYDQMEETMRAELPDGDELTELWVITQRQRLIQMASAPWTAWTTTETVVQDGFEVEKVKQHVRLEGPSWKVTELLAIMEERPGQPVVAAAPSRQLMMLASEAAQAAGYRVGHIIGNQSATARQRDIDAFQRGDLDLICVTTQAGGVGLTLTASSTIAFLQRPYSLIDSLQMEDRLHRIGAEVHDSIEVIDIVAEDTIESRIREVLKMRGGQLSDFVRDPRIVRELLGGPRVPFTRGASQPTREEVPA